MDIDEHAATRLVDVNVDAEYVDEMKKSPHIIFLHGDGSPVPEGERTGAYFTHYGVFENVKTAHQTMGDNMVLLVDGTLKLHDGGYVLLIAGTIHVYFNMDSKTVKHTYRPFGYALVPGENAKVKAI